ncbi:MAG: hypothetical protein ABJD68_07135 [Nakamurella sp.]
MAYSVYDDSLVFARRMDATSTVGLAHVFIVVLAVVRGDSSRIGPEILGMFRNGPPLPLLRALLAVLLLPSNEKGQAAAIFDELCYLMEELPDGPRWAGTLAIIGVAATLLGDEDAAERVYQRLLPSAGYYDADGSGVIFSGGSKRAGCR